MTCRARVYVSVLVSLLLLTSGPILGRQQASPFQAGVEIVALDVTVLDRGRNPVRGLQAGDFTVLEDGKPRPVMAFSAVDVNAPPADGMAVAGLPTPETEGRAIVILMDRSIPNGTPTAIARRVAASAVAEMGPRDLGAVIYTGFAASENLTSNRARLLERIGVGEPAAGLGTASAEAWQYATERAAVDLERPLPNANLSGECLCGVCVLDTIAQIAESLRDVEKRSKSLFFIGSDLAIESPDRFCVGLVRDARIRTLRALDAIHLTVHAFDPMGLETGTLPASRLVQGRDLTTAVPAQARGRLLRQGNLSVLPDRTGGRTVLQTNDPDRLVPAVMGENAAYYLLGFQPAAPADGKPHRIAVKVKRSGVTVSSRRTYARAAGAGG